MERRVLIVESQNDFALSMASVLKSAGYQTAMAHTAADAQREMEKRRPDLVVSARSCRTSPASSSAAQIKKGKFGQNLPVLLLSSDAGEEGLKSTARRPSAADGYLPIPFEMGELASDAARASSRRGAPRTRRMDASLDAALDGSAPRRGPAADAAAARAPLRAARRSCPSASAAARSPTRTVSSSTARSSRSRTARRSCSPSREQLKRTPPRRELMGTPEGKIQILRDELKAREAQIARISEIWSVRERELLSVEDRLHEKDVELQGLKMQVDDLLRRFNEAQQAMVQKEREHGATVDDLLLQKFATEKDLIEVVASKEKDINVLRKEVSQPRRRAVAPRRGAGERAATSTRSWRSSTTSPRWSSRSRSRSSTRPCSDREAEIVQLRRRGEKLECDARRSTISERDQRYAELERRHRRRSPSELRADASRSATPPSATWSTAPAAAEEHGAAVRRGDRAAQAPSAPRSRRRLSAADRRARGGRSRAPQASASSSGWTRTRWSRTLTERLDERDAKIAGARARAGRDHLRATSSTEAELNASIQQQLERIGELEGEVEAVKAAPGRPRDRAQRRAAGAERGQGRARGRAATASSTRSGTAKDAQRRRAHWPAQGADRGQGHAGGEPLNGARSQSLQARIALAGATVVAARRDHRGPAHGRRRPRQTRSPPRAASWRPTSQTLTETQATLARDRGDPLHHARRARGHHPTTLDRDPGHARPDRRRPWRYHLGRRSPTPRARWLETEETLSSTRGELEATTQTLTETQGTLAKTQQTLASTAGQPAGRAGDSELEPRPRVHARADPGHALAATQGTLGRRARRELEADPARRSSAGDQRPRTRHREAKGALEASLTGQIGQLRAELSETQGNSRPRRPPTRSCRRRPRAQIAELTGERDRLRSSWRPPRSTLAAHQANLTDARRAGSRAGRHASSPDRRGEGEPGRAGGAARPRPRDHGHELSEQLSPAQAGARRPRRRGHPARLPARPRRGHPAPPRGADRTPSPRRRSAARSCSRTTSRPRARSCRTRSASSPPSPRRSSARPRPSPATSPPRPEQLKQLEAQAHGQQTEKPSAGRDAAAAGWTPSPASWTGRARSCRRRDEQLRQAGNAQAEAAPPSVTSCSAASSSSRRRARSSRPRPLAAERAEAKRVAEELAAKLAARRGPHRPAHARRPRQRAADAGGQGQGAQGQLADPRPEDPGAGAGAGERRQRQGPRGEGPQRQGRRRRGQGQRGRRQARRRAEGEEGPRGPAAQGARGAQRQAEGGARAPRRDQGPGGRPPPAVRAGEEQGPQGRRAGAGPLQEQGPRCRRPPPGDSRRQAGRRRRTTTLAVKTQLNTAAAPLRPPPRSAAAARPVRLGRAPHRHPSGGSAQPAAAKKVLRLRRSLLRRAAAQEDDPGSAP